MVGINFSYVKPFCEKYDIEILVTIEHYLSVEMFFTTTDRQLQELYSRFSEQTIDLLTLSCFGFQDNYKAFNFGIIYTLVEKYYPMDLSGEEKINLQFQLRHFIIDTRQTSRLNN